MSETSPTARALQTLELIQAAPGVTAERLAERLGVSERAVRRYVGILRETGLPIESERGRYGGYRVGRGLRLPPLMFSTEEALSLVMAVLEGHGGLGDRDDAVAAALGKIIRVLPAPVAAPAEAVRQVPALRRDVEPGDGPRPDPRTIALLVQACAAGRPLRLAYRRGPDTRAMDVDPWAVVVRHARWYLLCRSHHADARRSLRIDRIAEVTVLDGAFEPPMIDGLRTLEEHLAEGWSFRFEIVFEAPLAQVAPCVPASLGRLRPDGPDRCRLTGTTDEPYWYVGQLTEVPATFRILGPPEMQEAARDLGRQLLAAGSADPPGPADPAEATRRTNSIE